MSRNSDWKKRYGWWLLSWCIPLGLHATTASDFAYRYPLGTSGPSAVWRVELTPAVYAASLADANLRDVVVVNADGQQVPFGPLPRTPPRAQTFTLKTTLLPLPSKGLDHNDAVRVQRNRDGSITIQQPATPSPADRPNQWLLDAGRPVSLDRIQIDPSALPDDARFQLAVQAGNDLQHWSARGEASEIVSVRRGADALVQRSVDIANSAPARYYRLVLRAGDRAPWDETQTPAVELHGSTVGTPDGYAAARRWLDAPAAVVIPSRSGTDYDYTLPAALPLEAARITLASTNTVTRYRLIDRDNHGDRLLAAGTAVQIGRDTDDAAPITFAPARVQHLRLHTDTPLAQPPTLKVAWRPDVFVFLAEGNAPYSLLAGSYAARRGDYPLQAALERMRPASADPNWQPPLATLGAASIAAGSAALLAPTPTKAAFDWTRALLWLVLIGGALAVAAMAWSLLRQQSPRRDGEP